MEIDVIEAKEQEQNYKEAAEEEEYRPQSYDDELQYNAFDITPNLPLEFRRILSKDIALGNYSKDRKDFNNVVQNLSTALILANSYYKDHVGYIVITDKNTDGYQFAFKDEDKILRLVPKEEKILTIKKLYEELPVFPKSKHNRLAKAYPLILATRGLGGLASKNVRTQYRKKETTLRDDTVRTGFLNFGKKQRPTFNEGY
jgi:hypothetical protein